MTLTEAAAKLGFKDASGLRHAARRGILRTEKIGPVRVTTDEWLRAYRAHVEATRGGRGKKRGPRKPHAD